MNHKYTATYTDPYRGTYTVTDLQDKIVGWIFVDRDDGKLIKVDEGSWSTVFLTSGDQEDDVRKGVGILDRFLMTKIVDPYDEEDDDE